MFLESEYLRTPDHRSLYFKGPALEVGARPAVIYFALSAHATLNESPINEPVQEWVDKGIRVFSWDLPFHSKEANPQEAMQQWTIEFEKNPHFISSFIEQCRLNLDFLIEKNLIQLPHLGIAGLSRGGFIATHFAAQDHRIRFILGYSPLTTPHMTSINSTFSRLNEDSIALSQLTCNLLHAQLKFYIGNHDTRVGTDLCYQFIKKLTAESINRGNRTIPFELTLFPSIGHKGHGTPSEIFRQGATWLTQKLLT